MRALCVFAAAMASFVLICGPSEALETNSFELLEAGRFDEARARALPNARAGIPGAAFIVAESYARAEGDGRDMSEALGWYEIAIEGGWREVHLTVGEILLWGDGVPAEPESALRHLREAAELGLGKAHHLIGLALRDGATGDADPAAALESFRAAGDTGWTSGYLAAASLAGFGPSELRNCGAALDDLQKAHDNGSVEATLLRARLLDGEGACERDVAKAETAFRLAERQKVDGATLALGRFLLGTDPAPMLASAGARRIEAIHWLALALHRGDEAARPWLDWAIAGLDPPLGPEELADIRGLQILLDGGDYALPTGKPERPVAPD